MLSTVSFGGSAKAQTIDAARPGSGPCPNPVVLKITRGGNTAATPDPVDSPGIPLAGIAYNQTAFNKVFRDTFHVKTGKCCEFKDGLLTVTYKALLGGAAGTATAANDGGGVIFHGVSVPGSSGPIWGTVVATGAVKTVQYTVPANVIATGRISFGAQDDSAVVSATLEVSGCCLEPTPPRG
ncbi:MAG TPA: hypothetical protein VE826_10705 [Dongiaceae bacterium]|nr:hypothetical protein [Dongiaceae bacterium]